LSAACAYYMKSPPEQMRDSLAYELTNTFIQGIDAREATAGDASRTGSGE
jgi:hypothetical protein